MISHRRSIAVSNAVAGCFAMVYGVSIGAAFFMVICLCSIYRYQLNYYCVSLDTVSSRCKFDAKKYREVQRLVTTRHFCAKTAPPKRRVAGSTPARGTIYFKSKYMTDTATSTTDLQIAAIAGDGDAAFALGKQYDLAEGDAAARKEAYRWYLLAAQGGHAEACFAVGLLLNTGDGVPQDDAAARVWFAKAAEQDIADAQFNLGLMYYIGEGGSKDFDAAANWFARAADQGHAKAQFNLGVMYLSGEGLKQDEVAVVKWWTLAAMQGHPGASANLDAAIERLAPDQLRIVQELTADWYSSVNKPF
jgi:hypothetical protein